MGRRAIGSARIPLAQCTETKVRQRIPSLIGNTTVARYGISYKANESPFDIRFIYHDDKFTYIKPKAREKFSVYEMKDGKPNLINYDLRDRTYIIPKVMNSGYVELGKKRMESSRKG